MPYSTDKRKQSGTAIFMALLVVAIVTTISVIWFTQTRFNIRRTQQMLLFDQIYLQTDAVLDWAIGALIADDTLPKTFPVTAIMNNQGVIAGRIEDYQASLQHADNNAIKSKYGMTTQSREYFILRAEARLKNQHVILYSLLHRKTVNGKIQVGIIWQSRGTN